MSAFTIGQTDITLYFRGWNTDGTPREDLDHSTSGLSISYVRERASEVVATVAGSPAPASLASDDAAHTNWGFRRIRGNLYRVDYPDDIALTGVKFAIPMVELSGVTFIEVPATELLGGDFRSAAMDVNVKSISGDEAAADNLEAAYDGAGYAGGTIKPLVQLAAITHTGATVPTVTTTGTATAVTTVNGLANNVITASAIASGAFTAAKFAAGAFDAVWTVATRTLSSFGSLVANIWDSLTSGHTTSGSVGKRIADNLDAAVTSRPSAAAIATAVVAAELAALDNFENNSATVVIGGITYNVTRAPRDPLATMEVA